MKLTHLASGRFVQTRPTATTGDRLAHATLTAVMANIQPASSEKNALYGGIMGRLFTIYCDAEIDVAEGDRFKDENGVYYKVVKGGITRRTYGAIDIDRIVVEQVE